MPGPAVQAIMRLCVVTPSHWQAVRGGAQYQARLLVDYLLERYDVRVSYLTTRCDPEYRPEHYEIVRFSNPTGLRRFAFFFDALKLYRALRQAAPEVIVQIVGCAHTGIAAFYARRHGCRMVWRVSSDRSVTPESPRWWRLHKRIERAFLDYGIRNADLILTQSRFQRDELARWFGRDDARVLPNFHPVPAVPVRRREPFRQIVWIANLKPLKNPGAFVRLAGALSGRSDIRFVMIGRAGDGAWMRRQRAEIALYANIVYMGERSQDEINATLERSDLLVNTSDFEGFSNTFIQAWMRCVPIVSLRVDPDGLLSSGGLGLLSGSEPQLCRDVCALLDAPETRSSIGARCRDYAVRHHSVANIDEVARLLRAPATRSVFPRPA